jgi:hypothetical protein
MGTRFDAENRPLVNAGLGIYTTPPSSPRQRFVPSKPKSMDCPDSPSSSHVARLRAQYDSPVREAVPTTPLTSTNLASLNNVEKPPVVVRAKVTPAAVVKRKPLLPGAERADPTIRPASRMDFPPVRAPIHIHADAVEPAYEAAPASASKDTVIVCVRVKPVEGETVWNVDSRFSKLSLTEGDRAGTEFRFGGCSIAGCDVFELP